MKWFKYSWVLIPVFFIATTAMFLLRGNVPLSFFEIRVLLLSAIFLAVLFFVGLLLTRNAIVANTRYLLTLKKSFDAFTHQMDKLGSTLGHTATSLSNRSKDADSIYGQLVEVTNNLVKIVKALNIKKDG